ncbi:fluoride efflux transporter FluC [Streptomyces sp. LN325]|uniref:fluoride efflux transporter FluC n=1 Tax=Streptomyces sp. LN325 TaxID=3112976 RepID=UPI0037180D6D
MTVPHPERVGTPDAPVGPPARRASSWDGQGPVVAMVALGGALGATARYGTARLWPVESGGFPWTTFWVNVAGCAVIGVFMVVITDVWAAHPPGRPSSAPGCSAEFTTFSTYAVDIRGLLDEGHPATGFAYLAATLFAALTAVWLAVTVTRRALAGRRR